MVIERRTCMYHWGKRHFVVPRLVNKVFGDGAVLLRLYPIMMRPHHFVVRIGSDYATSNWDRESRVPTDQWLDDVYDAIEEQFVEWPWAKQYGLRWPMGDDAEGERSSRIDWSEGSCRGVMDWPWGFGPSRKAVEA